jgi:hypothetical protein
MTEHPRTEAAPPPASARRSRMDQFIDGIELIAAIFVGLVAADIFLSVMLRHFFVTAIPDSYDYGSAS